MVEFLNRTIHENMLLESTPSSFHANHLDEELLDLLKTAGVKTVGIGVETGSQQMQRRLKKNLDLIKVKKVVDLIKSKGLLVHINFMVGFPHETMDQIKETLDLARELKAHSNQFLILVPYPGTEIYEQAKRDCILVHDDSSLDFFDPRKANALRSDEWTYEQLSDLIYDVNLELNFLNNPALSEEENRSGFLTYLDNLLLRIPGHVIALIILGYFEKKEETRRNWEERYTEALRSMEDREVNETFRKYLSLDHPIINDFNAYCETTHAQISHFG
jgi:radical SAM superfamily enzyme YgiQ (UPF0313 family)